MTICTVLSTREAHLSPVVQSIYGAPSLRHEWLPTCLLFISSPARFPLTPCGSKPQSTSHWWYGSEPSLSSTLLLACLRHPGKQRPSSPARHSKGLEITSQKPRAKARPLFSKVKFLTTWCLLSLKLSK